MYKYKVEINELKTKTISSMAELTQELDDMRNSDEIYITFNPIPTFSDLEEFCVLKMPKVRWIFKKRPSYDYYLELNFKYSDGTTGLCGYNTPDFNEIKGMISNLITHQKLPDISTWIMTKFDLDGKVLSYEESNPHL